MRKAYQNLKESKTWPKGEGIEITTTHLYIKFKPNNEDELAILKRDSTLILYSYPLDYEIVEENDYYHDPSIPEDMPTFQYTSVKVDKKLLSGVDYEVLVNLYIPDEEKDSDQVPAEEWVDVLVNEALRITGNLDDNAMSNGRSNGRIQGSSWRPKGRVTVWDDIARRYVPVVDLEVRARRWFTVHKGTTDAQGNYTCDGTFKNPADYSILWEKYHFSVRSGTFGQAEHSRNDIKGDWNPTFGTVNNTVVNNSQQYYALIFQAARDYYYGNRFGLSSPPRNSAWHP